MTTLQEYLNNIKNKEQVGEISLEKITEERKKQGITELLEGGELDLREFVKLEKVEIDPQLLKTPLTKVNVNGLINLKEFDWSNKVVVIETEEDKKLWEELGVVEDNEKKKVVREVNRLTKIWSVATNKTIKVHFATQKNSQEKLGDKEGITVIPEKEAGGYNIYLNLERKDKQGNFCPSLVFWSLTRELTGIVRDKFDKEPLFWTDFEKELNSVKQNLSIDYQKGFELLLNPSTFPYKLLEMKDILTVYHPNSEENKEFLSSKSIINQEIVDKTWKTIWLEIMEMTNEKLKSDSSEEKKKELPVKIVVDRTSEQEYNIQVSYHSQNPLQRQIRELILTTPLRLEIENLKKKKDQLPNVENYNKLTKQNKELQWHLRDCTGTGEKYQNILEKISKIN